MFELLRLDYPLSRLVLSINDPVQFDTWLAQSQPDTSGPWVLDLSSYSGHVDIGEFIRVARKHQVKLVGVMGAGGGALGQANAMGLAEFPAGGTAVSAPAPAPVAPAPAPVMSGAKVVEGPVRGGQQVWAQGQDLILLGPVSAGSEVMADGNVHCYGPVRGRVGAGVSGNSEARIFVRSLEAQLVSINGVFKAVEELEASEFWGKSAVISLNDDRLNMLGI